MNTIARNHRPHKDKPLKAILVSLPNLGTDPLQRHLELLGLKVLVVENAIELLEKFNRDTDQQFIFMDMDMAYMDIWTAAKAIIHASGDHHIPKIIALTPYAKILAADQSLQQYIDSYQSHDITLKQVRRLIDHFTNPLIAVSHENQALPKAS